MDTTALCSQLKIAANNLRKLAVYPTAGGPDDPRRVRIVALTQKPDEAIQRATQYMERVGTPEAKAKVQEFLNHIDPEVANAQKDMCSNRIYNNEAEAKEAIAQFLSQYNPWFDAIRMRMSEADFQILPADSLG